MAKAKATKLSSDTTITINPNSKNITYEIDSASVLEITLKNENGGVIGKTYYYWENMLVKKGNDLVIDTFYKTQEDKTKAIITTTIKNYFAQTVEHKFIYSSVYAGEETTTREITPSVNISHAGVFLEQINDSDYGYITGTTSSDNYAIQSNFYTWVYDKKGNDTYDIINTEHNAIKQVYDYNGNDKYYAKNRGDVLIYDYKGKDTYTSEYNMFIWDYAGNDNYTSKSKMTVHDYDGNDTYTVDSSKESCYITDNSGKDKYTMNQSDRIFIQDKGKGNDTYKATDCTGIWYWKEDDKSYSTFTISEEKGNETYDFQNIVFASHENFDPDNSEYVLHDMSGNDKYKLNGCGYFRVLDEKGNDSITIKNSESVYFDDLEGNDEWTISRTDNLHTLNEIYATDESGNDKWTISGVKDIINGGGFASIWDKAGKDTYLMNGGSDGAEITDDAGNDKYTVTEGSKNFTITDKGGEDIYKIIGTSDNMIKAPYIRDNGSSNDKYTLEFVDSGTDWNAIEDDGGKDSYNITNCNAIKLKDLAGDDKYNVKATESMLGSAVITDEAGEDTYSLKGTYDKKTKETTYLNMARVVDNGDTADIYNLQYTRKFVISDNAGDKDKYTIKSSYGNITDYKNGNDSYTVSKMVNKTGICIDDRGGRDTLKLADVNKNDIVFMSNYGTNGHGSLTRDEDASLILFNTKNNSFVKIDNFFTDNNEDCSYEGYGDGQVETIKAGNKAITVSADYFTMDILYQVANFLDITQCSVVEYLNDGTQEGINTLVAIFKDETIYGH